VNRSLARLASLARRPPDEIRTRALQEFSKRWSRPAACRFVSPPSTPPAFWEPPAAPRDLLERAGRICQHRFDLLGYEGLDFGDPIDWHFDPVHHKQTPRIPWHQIPFLDFDQSGDHKIIWELNRHQHLVTLAQAWRSTRDRGYVDEIDAQWMHWQQENPYPIGINWASSLEVAFRALSWLWVCQLLHQFPDGRLRALHLHAWHIERYLSTYYSPNTHLLGEAVALFSIGVLCPQLRRAGRWRDRGWAIVLRQAETQVRPDGFHFEQSVYYHVYALDFFRCARALAAANSIPIPPDFDRTIDRMTEALAAISQAGLPPRFGDDDGGRVIVPPPPTSAPHPPCSAALTSAGIYTMVSADAQLLIDAGPLGSLRGGHGHADALSIQLIRGGRDVLIDPGTFCYTCPARDRFRGTAAHNTLQVDGRDQALAAGPFAWQTMPVTTVDHWHSSEPFDLFAGHHDGYHPITHQRWVFRLKHRLWLVYDRVTESQEPAGTHRLDIHWHFLNERDIAIVPPAKHTWSQSLERWDWSPVYGRAEPAFVLRFSTETTLPAEFAVIVAAEPPSGEFTQTGPGAYRLLDEPEPGTWLQPEHEFLFSPPRFVYRAKTAEGVAEFAL
jgi:hypothetical protein